MRKRPRNPKKRAVKRVKESEPVNTPSEPLRPATIEIPEKLPWEQEPEPAKPVGPTPEQAAKDNLLNDEIEL